MDFERIYRDFTELARTGESADGSVTRLLFDKSFWEVARKTKAYMEGAGLTVWTDACGNVHGTWSCGVPEAKTVYMGSHLDTVKEGGLYDGMLGVVGAVEAFRAFLADPAEKRVNVHILATNGEEGNDLGGTFGSRAMAGLVDPDVPGYMEKAAAYGLKREDFDSVQLPMKDALCYLELHIEQGSTLDKAGEQIGIVTGIVGLQRYGITVSGESNHAGTTMMEYRKDALVGAAKLIAGFDRMAREYGNSMVATVGTISVFPGAVSVIPEQVEMVLEIRNLSEERLDRFAADAVTMGRAIPDVETTFQPIVRKAPVRCDGRIGKMLEGLCLKEGYSFRKMPSGATHDGNAMAAKMPIGMIFVPSRDGISHNKKEFTPWEDASRGMQVLSGLLKKINSQGGLGSDYGL